MGRREKIVEEARRTNSAADLEGSPPLFFLPPYAVEGSRGRKHHVSFLFPFSADLKLNAPMRLPFFFQAVLHFSPPSFFFRDAVAIARFLFFFFSIRDGADPARLNGREAQLPSFLLFRRC